MKTIEDILQESETDLFIDKANLDSEAIKCSILIHKYLKYHREYITQYIDLKTYKEKTTRILWYYYTGKANAEHLDFLKKSKPFKIHLEKRDIDKFIKSDSIYVNLDKQMEQIQASIKTIESIIDTLKYMPNSIKSAIEYQKFLQGA